MVSASIAASMGACIVGGAVIGTGASYLASSILGVEVTSMLLKYVPICVTAGIAGSLFASFIFSMTYHRLYLTQEQYNAIMNNKPLPIITNS